MNTWLGVAVFTIFGLIFVAPVLGAESGGIEEREQDLEEIEQRVRDLEQDLGARRERRESLLAELEQRDRDIADLARAGHQLLAMIQEQERALQELQAKLQTERDALHGQRRALGRLFRSAYVMGRGDRIRMLLNQEDTARLSRLMSYYGYLNRFRVRRIEEIATRARELERLQLETEDETRRLSRLAEIQDKMQQRLVAAQAERTGLIAALERTIATQHERITGLKADAEGLKQLLEHLRRRAQILPEADVRQEPIGKLRGTLGWPLDGGRLLAKFGGAKANGDQPWDGVVIAAAEGTEIRAVHHGRVAYADWLRGFGMLLIIEHDDGYMTLYGHNQTLLKEAGEWVADGDVIALSGSSGGHRSSGLYFAIRHRGRPLNPEHWCLNRGQATGWLGPHGPAGRGEQLADSPLQPDVTAALVAGRSAISDSHLHTLSSSW